LKQELLPPSLSGYKLQNRYFVDLDHRRINVENPIDVRRLIGWFYSIYI
jgi:hypothetical protein